VGTASAPALVATPRARVVPVATPVARAVPVVLVPAVPVGMPVGQVVPAAPAVPAPAGSAHVLAGPVVRFLLRVLLGLPGLLSL